MKKVLAVFLTLVVSFVLIGCHIDKPKTNEKFVGNFTSMGNALITFEVEKQDEQLEKAESIFNEIKVLFTNLNKLTDNFNEYKNVHNIAYINKNHDQKIEIDKLLYELIEYAENVKVLTNGHFDISIGLIIDEWKKLLDMSYDKQVTIDDLIATEKKVDLIPVIKNGILLEKENNKYYITIKKGVKIDLGAIAKGYAVKLSNEIIQKNEIKYYKILASQSSAYYGENPNRENGYYNIGLSGPSDYEDNHYGVIRVKNTSLTTSGDSIQRLKIGDRLIHHIISPKTKRPATNRSMVSIYHNDASYADALTTALMSMDDKELDEWYIENPLVYLIILTTDYKVLKYIPEELVIS